MKRGAYWDAATQIDFVVALKSGFSYLGEVKWGAINRSAVADFLRKLSSLPKELSYKPVIVSMEPIAGSLRKETAADLLSVHDLVG
jgi:hypothetical protein